MSYELSEDVLNIILDEMDLSSVCKVRVVNRKINKIVRDSFIIRKYIERHGKYISPNKHEKFFSFVGRSVDNLLFLKTIYKPENLVDIAAFGGHNNTLILLKKLMKEEFPGIYCSYKARIYAAQNGHDDTLLLLKKEFSKFIDSFQTHDTFDNAAKNGHGHTLLLLKKEFPEIEGTHNAFDLAANGNIKP